MSSLVPAQVVSLIIMLRPLKPMCDPMEVSWKWFEDPFGFKKKLGVNAAYLALRDCIGIPRYHENMAMDSMMLPTYCHELCHAAQRRRLGLLRYLWTKQFHRERLENEAAIEEKRVQALLKVEVL